MGRRRSAPFGLIPIVLILTVFFYIIMIIKTVIDWLFSLSAFTWAVIVIALLSLIIVNNYLRKKRKLKEELLLKQREEETIAKRKLLLKRNGTLSELKKMSPINFEYYICDLFKQIGYDAEVTKATGDGGKDIIIKHDNFKAIAECKRYDKYKISRPKIQQFHSAVIDCEVEIGYFITTGEFTAQAVSYALNKPITLISGMQLVKLIEMVTDSECKVEDFNAFLKRV